MSKHVKGHWLNMLRDTGDLVVRNDTIGKVRMIKTFIYHHCWMLKLMRSFTSKKELMRPNITKFVTHYFTLRNIQDLKKGQKVIFESKMLRASPYKGKGGVANVEYSVLVNTDLWKQIMLEMHMAIGECSFNL